MKLTPIVQITNAKDGVVRIIDVELVRVGEMSVFEVARWSGQRSRVKCND